MKKIVISSIVYLTIISCSKSNEEKIFTDFKTAEIQKTLKTTPKELNFEIESIAKVKVIKALDSTNYLHKQLIKGYYGANIIGGDTLSYNYVIKEIEKTIALTQEIIILRAKTGRSNDQDREYRDEMSKQKVFFEVLRAKSEKYSKNKNEVLSTEYQVKYSIDNPFLKIKQKLNSQIYSNKENTKIIREIKNK